MSLKAVLVDDEQLARDELGYLLGQVGGIEIIGQAGNGVEALSTIDRLQPDVVFLDVQMPGLTGFEVARRLVANRADAHIIFVTAYDQHAIEAFEVNAVDYLLKPVEPGRLEMAVDRVRRRIATDRAADGTVRNAIYASLVDDSITVVTPQYAGTSNYRTLDELQARLDQSVFWRVHRSHLVNINKIKEIVPWFSRNYLLRMKDEKTTEIPVSRTQTRRLREYLKL